MDACPKMDFNCVLRLINNSFQKLNDSLIKQGGGGRRRKNKRPNVVSEDAIVDAVVAHLLLHKVTSVDVQTQVPAGLLQQSGNFSDRVPLAQYATAVNEKLRDIPITFINRAVGTSLEKELDILFNLYLVNEDYRPAYLHEASNFSTNLLDPMKVVYPEFQYTVELELNGMPHRIYVHKHPLIKSDSSRHDADIAINLGFSCLGLPDANKPRKVLKYYVIRDTTEYLFYTEICDLLTPENIVQEDNFRKASEELNLGFEKEITDLIPDQMILTQLIRYYSNPEEQTHLQLWFEQHDTELANMLVNYGILTEEEWSVYRFEKKDLTAYPKLLLFVALNLAHHTIFGLETPFTQETDAIYKVFTDNPWAFIEEPLHILNIVAKSSQYNQITGEQLKDEFAVILHDC